MLKQTHIFIKGDVIGVGFRAWTKIQAMHFGVTGWVRNNDNSVEAVLQGEEDVVNQMILRLKKGPPVSKVESVKIVWETVSEKFTVFEIAATI